MEVFQKCGHPKTNANTVWVRKSDRKNEATYRRCLICKRESARRSDEKRYKARRAAQAKTRRMRDKYIRELYEQGVSVARIADEVGCGYVTVKSVVDPEFRAQKQAEKKAQEDNSPLMVRHRAAMEIVKQCSEGERWALLAAVVWPETDELLEMERMAA